MVVQGEVLRRGAGVVGRQKRPEAVRLMDLGWCGWCWSLWRTRWVDYVGMQGGSCVRAVGCRGGGVLLLVGGGGGGKRVQRQYTLWVWADAAGA